MTTDKPKRYTRKDLRLEWKEEGGEHVAELPGADMRVSLRPPNRHLKQWGWRLNWNQNGGTWLIDAGEFTDAKTLLQAQAMAEAAVLALGQSIVHAFVQGRG